MANKMRIGCVEVIVGIDLEISYRVSLPVKPEHVHLFSDNPNCIKSYVRNNKIRYAFVNESKNRLQILRSLAGVQAIIAEQKIKDAQARHEDILGRLSMFENQFNQQNQYK
jgi:hypothetical protein